MIHQESSNIIVDSVRVKYYGQEKCNYYKNGKKIYSYLDESTNKDEYILNVFYKEKEYKYDAEKLLEDFSNNK